MPLRTKLFIIISAVALLILGISIFLLIINKKSAPMVLDQTPANTTNVVAVPSVAPGATPTTIPSGVTVKPLTTAETEENTVKKLATVFVERFNTYSSDAAYQNIRDVETLVTPAYWKKISTALKSPVVPAASYSAATAEVIVAEVNTLSNNAATVTIKTRRSATEKGVDATNYQTLTIAAVKQNNVWLVDGQTVSK